MHSLDIAAICQLIVIFWGVEIALLQRKNGRHTLLRDAKLSAAIVLLVLVLLGTAAIAPPQGVVILAAVVATHGLIVALLWLMHDRRAITANPGESSRV